MRNWGWRWGRRLLGMLLAVATIGLDDRAHALPGETVGEVATWIQMHPTLQPAPGETLLIRRTDSPSRRFTFEASIRAPGRAVRGDRRDIIRSEQISLFDTVYGVTPARLEESLDILYGAELLADYQQAEVVYQYPTPELIERADRENLPLLRLSQGEVRQGDRFAYWIETVQIPDRRPQSGRIVVFLLEDLPKVLTELEAR